jgi:hypothetical protein
MNETVIVTTYRREELLFLCLEAIRREDPDVRIWIFSDRGADSPDLESVRAMFHAQLTIRANHQFYGNSFNLLNACEWCVNPPLREVTGIVHLVEDDVIVHPGYFTWAREQLETGKYAVACGRIPAAHIENWYESPCASWNAVFLQTALCHLIPEYFCGDRKVMQRVLDEKIFPNSKYKKGGAEQDGFLLRAIEHYKWKTIFPPKPLATHLGWWGYNRPPGTPRPEGSFEERINACRSMFGNVEKRRLLFGKSITDRELGLP